MSTPSRFTETWLGSRQADFNRLRVGRRKGLAAQVRAKLPPKWLAKRRRPQKSHLASGVGPWTDWSGNLFGVRAAEA